MTYDQGRYEHESLRKLSRVLNVQKRQRQGVQVLRRDGRSNFSFQRARRIFQPPGYRTLAKRDTPSPLVSPSDFSFPDYPEFFHFIRLVRDISATREKRKKRRGGRVTVQHATEIRLSIPLNWRILISN